MWVVLQDGGCAVRCGKWEVGCGGGDSDGSDGKRAGDGGGGGGDGRSGIIKWWCRQKRYVCGTFQACHQNCCRQYLSSEWPSSKIKKFPFFICDSMVCK